MMTNFEVSAVKEWLEEFASCVRNKAFDAGEALFLDDSTGFGTWTKAMKGLQMLREEQWEKVWTQTRGFHFDIEEGSFLFSGEQSPTQCVATVTWSSIGLGGEGEFERSGCATIVLVHREGTWSAQHTHFSQTPQGKL